MFLTGVLQSLGIVLFNAVGMIILRLTSNAYDVNPILYTIIAFMTTSVTLSLIAGPGKYAVESIKSKDSWLYALFLVGLYISQVFLIKHVSGTEVNLFNNMAIPITMVFAWLFLNRKPGKTDILGMVTVSVALVLAVSIQPQETMLIVLYLAMSVGVCNMLMTISTEIHSQSVKANESGYFRDRVRVVAFVSFIAAMMFMLLALTVSILKTYYLPEYLKTYFAFMPDINNFVNLPTVLLGIFMGVFVVTINRYLNWSAAYKIKSENVLCILAITPLVTFLLEWLLSALPWFKSNASSFDGERSWQLLCIVLLSILGAGMPVFRKAYKHYLELKDTGLSFKEQLKQAQSFDRTGLDIRMEENNTQDYEVVLATISHCQNNLEKAAEMLELPLTTLKVIYDGEGDYVLSEDLSVQINKNFRERVVLSDSLTGLPNRTALMSALEKLYNSKAEFGLVFIDLNKFKQINDNHGHEAGDAALIEFAKRIDEFLDGACYAARFAGDEFCVLLPYGKSKTLGLLEDLKDYAVGSFNFNGTELEILASFGLANSIDYATAQALIDSADEIMYKDKRKG